SLPSLRSTRFTQEAHVMPWISRSTVRRSRDSVGSVSEVMGITLHFPARGGQLGVDRLDGVSGFVDGVLDGFFVQRRGGADRGGGDARGVQDDLDVVHAVDFLEFFGYRGHAVAAGHAGNLDFGAGY